MASYLHVMYGTCRVEYWFPVHAFESNHRGLCSCHQLFPREATTGHDLTSIVIAMATYSPPSMNNLTLQSILYNIQKSRPHSSVHIMWWFIGWRRQ